jgi:hypothetical protein
MVGRSYRPADLPQLPDGEKRFIKDEHRRISDALLSLGDLADLDTISTDLIDDYEEGTWTPVLTFDTAGDLSVAYTVQIGAYRKIGSLVFVTFSVVTSTFTHTTASGNLRITGLPFQPATSPAANQRTGTLGFQGITKAGYTQFVPAFDDAAGQMFIIEASGSAQTASTVVAADMPTGGSVVLRGGGCYVTD